MTTVNEVFTITMTLMDNMPSTGVLNMSEVADYSSKVPHILNVLQVELSPVGDLPKLVTKLSDELSVSDYIARTVLPYGLAAHLLLKENPNLADFCNQRYEELKTLALRKQTIANRQITDVYAVYE